MPQQRSSPHLTLIALKTEVCLGLTAELVSQQILGLNVDHFESTLQPGVWWGWVRCISVWMGTGGERKQSAFQETLLSLLIHPGIT